MVSVRICYHKLIFFYGRWGDFKYQRIMTADCGYSNESNELCLHYFMTMFQVPSYTYRVERLPVAKILSALRAERTLNFYS